jgi:hypothetical protein
MKTEDFEKLKKQIPNFVQKYCKHVPISQVKQSTVSQHRASGHQLKNVPSMREDIENRGQQSPVDVETTLPGVYKLTDGNTRYLAISESEKVDEIFVCWYYDSLNLTAPQKKIYQVKANLHTPSERASKEDLKLLVGDLSSLSWFDNTVGFKYWNTTLPANVKVRKRSDGKPHTVQSAYLTKAIDELYIELEGGFNKNLLRSTIKKVVINKVITAQMEPLTSDSALEAVQRSTAIRWKGAEVGVEHNNEVVYIAGNPKMDIRKDQLAAVINKKIANPNAKVLMVIYERNLANMGPGHLETERKKAKQKVAKYNKTVSISGKVGLWDNVYYINQIKKSTTHAGDGVAKELTKLL